MEQEEDNVIQSHIKKEIIFPAYIWDALEDMSKDDPEKRKPEDLALDLLDEALFVHGEELTEEEQPGADL